jgi:hypothetical protein
VSLRRKLSPIQQAEIWAWHQARKALGTFKTKAREYGVSPAAISEYIHGRRRKEAKDHARRRIAVSRSRMSAFEQMR